MFYIESLPSIVSDQQSRESLLRHQSKSPSPELTRRRSTRAGKLMRLIRRRESRRCSVRNKKTRDVTADKGHALSQVETKGLQKNANNQGIAKEVTFRDSEVSFFCKNSE